MRIFSIRGTSQQLEKARQLIDERIGVGGLAPPVLARNTIVWPDIHERTCQCRALLGWAGPLWSWWPAGCHQRLNMKNPSNGLNGVHQRPALPSDLACWLPLNTSVVSYSPPLLCFRAQSWGATAASVWIPTTRDLPLLLNSKMLIKENTVLLLNWFWTWFHMLHCCVFHKWTSDVHDRRMGYNLSDMAASRPTGAQ